MCMYTYTRGPHVFIYFMSRVISMKKLQTLLFALMMMTVSLAGCTDSSNQIDLDNDGIPDVDDLCPDTDAQLTVDLNGCADNQLDDDGDLVMNDVDLCPLTPAGEAVDADGCSQTQLDDDGDLVMNDVDLCPLTPAGEAVDADGCSQSQLDDDGDGIMNDVDLCLMTPLGEIVNLEGCENPHAFLQFADSNNAGPDYYNLRAHNNSLYWCARNSVPSQNSIPIASHGIWMSDGTFGDMHLIKQLGQNNDNCYIYGFANDFFFFEDNSNHEIWMFDTNNPISSTNPIQVSNSICHGNTQIFDGNFYFHYDDGTNGCEVWKFNTSQTMSSTNPSLLKEMSLDSDANFDFEVVDANLFISTYPERELWISDGSTAGTTLVTTKFVDGKYSLSLRGQDCAYLYINFYNTTTSSTELWVSDGTDAGTIKLNSNLWISTSSYLDKQNDGTICLNDEFWFINNEDNNGNFGIWKSDGTVSGTNVVVELSWPRLAGVLDEKILVNSDGTLWMLEGPSYSPTQLLTVDSHPIHVFEAGINTAPYRLTSVGSVLYGNMCVDSSCLDNTTAGTGFEFYKYDISLPMSSSNPELIKEFTPGQEGTPIDKIVHLNGKIYFMPSLYAPNAWWVYEI